MTSTDATITRPDAAHKLDRAASQLVMQQPFFAALYMRLIRRERTDIETMQTDGVHLDYSPEWTLSLPVPQLIGVLAHEVSHLAALHHTRRGGRDLADWNRAADYAVNPIIRAAGLELPPGILDDARFHGLSAEAIYAQLVKQAQQQPDASGSDSQSGGGSDAGGDQQSPGAGMDPGGCGGIVDAALPEGTTAQTQANLDSQAAEWEIAVAQAIQVAKAAGKMPAHLVEEIKHATRPQLDWRDQLRRFFSENDKTDQSWSRPNRRYISSGIYLPSQHSEDMGEMVLAIDSSSSVGPDELAAFAAEFSSVLSDVRPRLIHVVYCDTAVRHTEEFTRDDFDVTLSAHGRGGTRVTPVFDWIAARGIDPACLVYLTDLYVSDFPAAPAYPTLWVSTGLQRAPFGDIVELII